MFPFRFHSFYFRLFSFLPQNSYQEFNKKFNSKRQKAFNFASSLKHEWKRERERGEEEKKKRGVGVKR
jgi:hypothetical protein